jgi:hypothetical protein
VKVLGIVLVLLAAGSELVSLFRADIPFRVPLTAEDAMHAAIVLVIAGALAVLAGASS